MTACEEHLATDFTPRWADLIGIMTNDSVFHRLSTDTPSVQI